MIELLYHPLADVFPLMHGQAFDELTEDIRSHGLKEPIWLYEHKVLDGRNRLRACNAADVDPVFCEYEGDDPLGFVVSLNLHRRHLDESQRAMVGEKLATMKNGGDRKSDQSANLRTDLTVSQAAELLNVSERSITSAKKVQSQGIPELVRKVESGEVKVSVAADVATLPEDQQRHLVALNDKAILNAARDIRSQKAIARREENDRIRQKALAVPPPEGQYRCIVVDPPWPVKKVQRDDRPNQTPELDYPVMSLDEIHELDIPSAELCHLYLWTTQRFLYTSFDLLQHWGFSYLSVMVWHKPGGFQVSGFPQFNCEFVLIGRKGGLEFNDTKDFKTCFQAPRREHSRKPDYFYDLVKRVSPGPRLDMFSREPREGFEQFGVEPRAFV